MVDAIKLFVVLAAFAGLVGLSLRGSLFLRQFDVPMLRIRKMKFQGTPES